MYKEGVEVASVSGVRSTANTPQIKGEFHILFHTVLLAIDVIVERSISCICHRILRISPIDFVEFLHQRYEAIHI